MPSIDEQRDYGYYALGEAEKLVDAAGGCAAMETDTAVDQRLMMQLCAARAHATRCLAFARKTKGNVRFLQDMIETKRCSPETIGTTTEEIDALHAEDIERAKRIASDCHAGNFAELGTLHELLTYQVTLAETGMDQKALQDIDRSAAETRAEDLYDHYHRTGKPFDWLAFYQHCSQNNIDIEFICCSQEKSPTRYL